jgi:hypothetical protein
MLHRAHSIIGRSRSLGVTEWWFVRNGKTYSSGGEAAPVVTSGKITFFLCFNVSAHDSFTQGQLYFGQTKLPDWLLR